MCLTTPILTDNCPKGRAGLSKAYVTECSNIVDIVFDVVTREVIGLVMSGAPGAGVFVLLEFEKNTASFEQAKTRIPNSNSINVAQTFTFFEPILNPLTRRLLEDLNDCCCYVAIIKDNAGRLHVFGISYYPDTDTYEYEDLRTGDGTANSGADPTADKSEYQETLVANVNFYAPFWGLPESSIPT